MQQFLSFKEQYPDKVLLFRMGDFYETFGEDAKKAAKILNITLTSRDKGKDATPMAGFPHHALDQYLKKFVDHNMSVVVVDQLEDPKQAKGIVKRGVTRIVTPGTADGDLTDSTSKNYIIAFASKKKDVAASLLDLSTGEFRYINTLRSRDDIETLLTRFRPKEILLDESKFYDSNVFGDYIVQLAKNFNFVARKSNDIVTRFFEINTTDALGLQPTDPAVTAIAMIIAYVEETQRIKPTHIPLPSQLNLSSTMLLDASTLRNLEILESLRQKDSSSGHINSLLSLLNTTKTSMGARLLKEWLVAPSIQISVIKGRLEVVQFLQQNIDLLDNVRQKLDDVYDIERIIGKIGLGRANPRDIVSLAHSLEKIGEIITLLEGVDFVEDWFSLYKEQLSDLAVNIRKVIAPTPPVSLLEGGIIADGYSDEVDTLREIANNSQEWLESFLQSERDKTGISSMKLGFNKVFGYYLDVTKMHIDKVPDYYIRKQTLVNSERYITPELKEKEDAILNAKDKLFALEYQLFTDFREKLGRYLDPLRNISLGIARLDVLGGFAQTAIERDYTEPEIVDFAGTQSFIRIKDGRHPVVEAQLQQLGEREFIANDITLGENAAKVAILTGPNMSGKSTYIRQVALLAIMAQVGSFVPAKSMEMSLVDRVFARVGASDDLAGGRSTFMVEMDESATILRNATADSLIVLDEVGRGTSTYDGVSIAWAIVEYIIEKIQARTLFATHYHELNQLKESYPQSILNLRVQVDEGKEIIFLHKIQPGVSDRSYGIHVAKLAGMPKEVLSRADQLLRTFERSRKKANVAQYSMKFDDIPNEES